MSEKKLCKSSTDIMISGVCAGVAKYFDLDTGLVRGLFALLCLFAGSGIWLYIAAALLLPVESTSDDVVDANPEDLRDL